MHVCHLLPTFLPDHDGIAFCTMTLAQAPANDGDVPTNKVITLEYGALAGSHASVTSILSSHGSQDYGPDICGMDERIIPLIQHLREISVSGQV